MTPEERAEAQRRHMAHYADKSCYHSQCAEPVVGSSILGRGHVCEWHNEHEWATRMTKNQFRDVRNVGAEMLHSLSTRFRRVSSTPAQAGVAEQLSLFD